MQFSWIIWSLVVCLLAPAAIYAQMQFIGKCPEIKGAAAFNIDKFMHVWYEYSSYPDIRRACIKCNSVAFKRIDNDIIAANYSTVDILTGMLSTRTEICKFVPPDKVQVGYSENEYGFKLKNFMVLGTDYESYAVIYSCIERYRYFYAKHVWILTRSRNPSRESIDAAEKVLEDNQISKALRKAIQNDCPVIDSALAETSL